MGPPALAPVVVGRRRARSKLKVRALGGAGEVGGSAFLVTNASDQAVLLDCGQRVRGEYGLDTEPQFHRRVGHEGRLHGILLSHAHIDHVGSLPVLHREQSHAQHEPIPIYMTAPTRQLAQIMLEESGEAYDTRKVDITKGEQFDPAFLAISPNNKIPAIVDHTAQGDVPVFETAAILTYLAEKSGRFLPADPAARYGVIQWLMFQMGGVGPMFGQLGFFHKFAGKDYEDKRPRDRYVAEAKRLLGVLDRRLDGRQWIMGDEYTIADIATFPWIRNLVGFYGAGDLVDFDQFTQVKRVLETFVARPAVQAGLAIPKRP